jgi:acetyltransferase-like isoleucine patch superfamily enzyme/dTDP-4-dehydrorhamnose 3,5-epimerase-like enzyme
MRDQKIFIHPNAIVEPGAEIGEGTRISAFVHILAGAKIGKYCTICNGVFVENDAVIGNRVTVQNGVQVWSGVWLEDDVFVGPNATFTNNLFPRSNRATEKPIPTYVRKGASIGANATILAGVEVGGNAMVGAGAVVTHHVPPNSIVVGNPARIRGYVSATARNTIRSQVTVHATDELSVCGAKLIRLPRIVDLRGSLSFGEYDTHLPFAPKRYFVIFDVPSMEVRGEHAHRSQHQYLVCVQGSCAVVLDDGKNRDEVVLNQPDIGLHIPPMVWAIEYKFTRDAILVVLASDVYDASDYIRSYEQYLSIVSSEGAK